MNTKQMRIKMVQSKYEHKSSGLWLNTKNNKLWFDKHGKVAPHYIPMHLYVVSDIILKEGDWALFLAAGIDRWTVERCRGTETKRQWVHNKIEATTDKSLGLYVHNNKFGYNVKYIPQSFIKEFIKSKNKIEFVNVELEPLYYTSDVDMFAKVENDELVDEDYLLKINENNEITIRLIKDESKESLKVTLKDYEKINLLKVLYEHESEDLIKNISLDKELKIKIDAVVKEHFIKKEYFK